MFRDGWDLVALLATTNLITLWAWIYQHRQASQLRDGQSAHPAPKQRTNA